MKPFDIYTDSAISHMRNSLLTDLLALSNPHKQFYSIDDAIHELILGYRNLVRLIIAAHHRYN